VHGQAAEQPHGFSDMMMVAPDGITPEGRHFWRVRIPIEVAPARLATDMMSTALPSRTF